MMGPRHPFVCRCDHRAPSHYTESQLVCMNVIHKPSNAIATFQQSTWRLMMKEVNNNLTLSPESGLLCSICMKTSSPFHVIALPCHRRIASSHMLSRCSLQDWNELFETTSMYVATLNFLSGMLATSVGSSNCVATGGSSTTVGLCNEKRFHN